jgi:hypothetical protein
MSAVTLSWLQCLDSIRTNTFNWLFSCSAPQPFSGKAPSVTPNPDFGRLITSYAQEGVDAQRTVRLRLRITF